LGSTIVKKRPSSGEWPASHWNSLFQQATAILDELDPSPYWTFGGGTALALRYDHRISYDVDVFMHDAQILGFLSPRLNDFAASIAGEYQEAANGIKLVTAHGDIDFIVAASVTECPPDATVVEGVETLLDTPAEILAKKIQYRGIAFAQRDIFDLAAVMREETAEADAAVRACTADAVAATAQAIAGYLPRLAVELPTYVNPTARYGSFIKDIPAIVLDFPGVRSLIAATPKRRRATRHK
jgi:hypothetical protein